MLTDTHYSELEEKGYTVIGDVLIEEECDKAIGQYQEWLSQFKDGAWPYSLNSLIQKYGVGHMEPTWYMRLRSKKIFAQIWKTDKLLSSFDGIAIGRPPEDGQEEFQNPGSSWLHVDQNANRTGLHAYQGAVYLEEACEDDWTLCVMEGSHKHLEQFYLANPTAATMSEERFYYRLQESDIAFMNDRGCPVKRVPVPKGGMVVWDSRLVHANARPNKGRQHPGRWRYCVFVSMTPAIWASEEDLELKKQAYETASATKHWSSQGIFLFDKTIPSTEKQDVDYPKEVPEVAKVKDARLLAGLESYDFSDGKPTGEDKKPVFKVASRG